MPALKNFKHELFAQELAKGTSQLAAYETAGYKPTDAHACRLASDGRVRARVAELQAEAAKQTKLTIHDIVRQLDEDRAFARSNGHSSAAVSASMGQAKLLGYLVDKIGSPDGGPIAHDITFGGKSAREILEERLRGLAERMGQGRLLLPAPGRDRAGG
jgi:hypothetical protein